MGKINYAMETKFKGNKIITNVFNEFRDPIDILEANLEVKFIHKDFFDLSDVNDFKNHKNLDEFIWNVFFLSTVEFGFEPEHLTLYALNTVGAILWKVDIKATVETPKVEYIIEDILGENENFYEYRESLIDIICGDEERWEGVTLAKDILTHILPMAKIILSSHLTIEEIDGDMVYFSVYKTEFVKTKYLLEIENMGIFNNVFTYTLYELDELENTYEIEQSEIELQITM